MPKRWSEEELVIAMNLYCQLPFGQLDQRNKRIQDVAARMGRTPSSLAMKLCNLASLDPVQQARGVVGLKGVSTLDRKVWGAFQTDWSSMAERSAAALESLMGRASETSTTAASAAVDSAIMHAGPTEVARLVAQRRVQGFFRSAVMTSYSSTCAISGVDDPRLLNASHIIPWSVSEQRRADPTNGICLNALYDRAFDRGLITFDDDLRLVVSRDLKSSTPSTWRSSHFGKLEGTQLTLPQRFRPDRQALRYHQEHVFVGS